MDIAIPEAEQLISLHEMKELNANTSSSTSNMAQGSTVSNAFDPLRLTDDDRVNAFVLYASLLSKAKRLKEAHKVLSEAKKIFSGTKQEVQGKLETMIYIYVYTFI